jgi:hypothetical protein
VGGSNGSPSVVSGFNLDNDQINIAPERTMAQSHAASVGDVQNPALTMNETASVSVGGPGNDTFIFGPKIGADTIDNFYPQNGTNQLDHFADVQTLQQLASLITPDVPGDAVIDPSHSDSIPLPGMNTTQLQAHLHSLVHLH